MKVTRPLPNPLQTSPVAYQVLSPVEMGDGPMFIAIPSKRILIGAKVYPFVGLQYITDAPLASARYRKNGGGWNTITKGTYTDLYEAIILTTDTITTFGTDTYELELTDGDAVVDSVEVDVVCELMPMGAKATKKSLKFAPFRDVVLGDVTYIDKIEYSVAGDTTVAQVEVPREVLFTGTHDGPANNPDFVDSSEDYDDSCIRVDTDIIKNTTDNSEGTITAVDGDTIYAALSGGAEDDWDVGDSAQVVRGGDLLYVARTFMRSLSNSGLHIFTFYATDTSLNVSQTTFVVGVSE